MHAEDVVDTSLSSVDFANQSDFLPGYRGAVEDKGWGGCVHPSFQDADP